MTIADIIVIGGFAANAATQLCTLFDFGAPAVVPAALVGMSSSGIASAMFNLALLPQRSNRHNEAAECWRRYLVSDGQSEWAARARRSLKFCEMQVHASLRHTMK
jgi:hypothetical protein